MGKLSGIKDTVIDMVNDGDTMSQIVFFGAGLLFGQAGLRILPSDYSTLEGMRDAAIAGLSLTSSALLISYPISESIKDYRRLPDEHKPHKIIESKVKNLYYRMRRR
jgi:hypothetical protein